jgi:hypothetical protein
MRCDVTQQMVASVATQWFGGVAMGESRDQPPNRNAQRFGDCLQPRVTRASRSPLPVADRRLSNVKDLSQLTLF